MATFDVAEVSVDDIDDDNSDDDVKDDSDVEPFDDVDDEDDDDVNDDPDNSDEDDAEVENNDDADDEDDDEHDDDDNNDDDINDDVAIVAFVVSDEYSNDSDAIMVDFVVILSQLFKYCNNDICSWGDNDCIRTAFVYTVLLAGIHSSDILYGKNDWLGN